MHRAPCVVPEAQPHRLVASPAHRMLHTALLVPYAPRRWPSSATRASTEGAIASRPWTTAALGLAPPSAAYANPSARVDVIAAPP